ncbi:MAG: hypothetical protein F4Z22_05485 [Acidimicrobiia bacterium]|nr:hypothetical protein [Acidimicrobiia bacterium]
MAAETETENKTATGAGTDTNTGSASAGKGEPQPDAADSPDSSDSPKSPDVGDELPPELDVSGYVGPYVFPNNSRRRVPGALYAFLGVVVIATWALTLSSDPNIVNGGFLAAGIALLVLAAYHFRAGWDLRVEETDALLEAVRAVGFPVGHASAQMGWRGWFSRPTWRILVFSNEVRPLRRGLVLVDGVEPKVLDVIVEDNPEDWSSLTDSDIHGPPD